MRREDDREEGTYVSHLTWFLRSIVKTWHVHHFTCILTIDFVSFVFIQDEPCRYTSTITVSNLWVFWTHSTFIFAKQNLVQVNSRVDQPYLFRIIALQIIELIHVYDFFLFAIFTLSSTRIFVHSPLKLLPQHQTHSYNPSHIHTLANPRSVLWRLQTEV